MLRSWCRYHQNQKSTKLKMSAAFRPLLNRITSTMLVLFRLAPACGLCSIKEGEGGGGAFNCYNFLTRLRHAAILKQLLFLLHSSAADRYCWGKFGFSKWKWLKQFSMKMKQLPVPNLPNIPSDDNRKPLSDLLLSRRQNIQKNISENILHLTEGKIIFIYVKEHMSEQTHLL